MNEPLSFASGGAVLREHPDGSTTIRSAEPLAAPPPTLFSWLERWACERPDRSFVTEPRPGQERAVLTYGEAAAEVDRLAAFLASTGVAPGDRVVILVPNSIRHLLWGLAAMRCGAIYVPMAPQYAGPGHDAGKLAGLLRRLRPRLVVCAGPAQLSRVPPGQQAATAGALWRAAGTEGAWRVPPLPAPEALAKILFTSGSAGEPKAVPYTHGQLTAAMTMTTQVWTFVSERPPVLLDWLPWNHAFGGTANLHLVLSSGGTMHIDDAGPTPSGIARTLAQIDVLRPNVFFAVPATLDLLRDRLGSDRAAARSFFGAVRAVFSAGAALSPETFGALRRLSQEAGSEVVLLSGWGGTETGPGATLVHSPDAQPGWIGPPLPGVELKLTPRAGKLHLSVRGPNVFGGYWDDPEATAAAFDADGFYATGDAGKLVDAANPHLGLVFDGRLGDDFKLANGTWINYARVRERLLSALDGHAADVVVGVPDAPQLVALVWPRDAARLSDDVLERALARYNRETTRPSDRLLALGLLQPPPQGAEISPKGQLRARHVREARQAEFLTLLAEGATR